MKKLLFIIICAVAVLCGGGGAAPAAAAESGYAQAVTTTAYFFTEKDVSTSLFAVPYTYCVRIVRDDGQWLYVQYAEDAGNYRAVYGYVLKADFAVLSEPPAVTYLVKNITVTYSAGDGDPALPGLGEIEMQAAFYGTYYSGATAYSYVLCGDSFGYISGANDDYPLNALPDEEEPPPPDDGGEGGNAGIVTAVIIAALTCGAIILVFLTSKKKKPE